jgi:hypothetical protein
MKVNADAFNGPLFIIGTGRSGTKLLRDLLNRNPGIGIPTAETGFLPYMIDQFGDPPNSADGSLQLDEFYKTFSRTNFFWYMRREGRVLSKQYLKQMNELKSWSSIFESILRFYAPPGRHDAFIWGDKTPGSTHISYMILLKTIFPNSKFLHIVRDPRDVCLSMKRAWGKSLYRAASNWREQVDLARRNSRRYSEDYKEVLYESLLADPESVLQSICEFLQCEFLPVMTTLQRPSESTGDAKGQARIVQDNTQKYRTRLTPSQIRRIEEITFPTLQATGYRPDFAVRFRPLGSLVLTILTVYDAWITLRFETYEKGLREGLALFLWGLKLYAVAAFHRLRH